MDKKIQISDIKEKKNRLLSLITEKKYEFAEKIGIRQNRLSEILNSDKWSLPDSLKNGLLKEGYSIDWIETGIGSPRLVDEKIDIEKVRKLHSIWLKYPDKGQQADFSGKNLQGTNFRGMDFSKAIFMEADLEKSDFSGATLDGADFMRAKLDGSNFTRSYLKSSNFKEASIKNCNFTGAWLTNTILFDSDASYSDFSESYLKTGMHNNCNIEGAKIRDDQRWPSATNKDKAIVTPAPQKNGAGVTDLREAPSLPLAKSGEAQPRGFAEMEKIEERHIWAYYYEDVSASAGPGLEPVNEEKTRSYLPIFLFEGQHLHDLEKIICIPVKGDSMSNLEDSRSLQSGELIFIVPMESVDGLQEGEVYVLRYYKEILVKKVQYIRGQSPKMRLISLNKEYETINIEGEDLKEVKIIGEVIGKYTRYKR